MEPVVSFGLEYRVRPENVDRFVKMANAIVASLQSGAGHLHTSLLRDVNEPTFFAVFTEWESEEALKKFTGSDTFKKVVSFGLAELLSERPRHRLFVEKPR